MLPVGVYQPQPNIEAEPGLIKGSAEKLTCAIDFVVTY
jgi:hypothetical protein